MVLHKLVEFSIGNIKAKRQTNQTHLKIYLNVIQLKLLCKCYDIFCIKEWKGNTQTQILDPNVDGFLKTHVKPFMEHLFLRVQSLHVNSSG